LFDGRELRRFIFFALALVACVWPLTAEAARIDLIWKVQLEGPPLDKNGNQIDPNIVTAKLLGAGRLVELEVSDVIQGLAKGAAALRVELFLGADQKINLQAFGDGDYDYSRNFEWVEFPVKVLSGVEECKQGSVGFLRLIERTTKVDQVRLKLCGMDFRWTNRLKDQTVAVSVKKDPNISGTWDFTDDPAGNMTITRNGTTNEYTGKYRGTGAHSQLRGTLIGTVGPDYWSGNFTITELGNVVAGTFKSKIFIPEEDGAIIMVCQFSGGSLAKFTLKEIQ
jgi:hypothetical protein